MSVNAKSSNRIRQVSCYAALFVIALTPACRKAKNYSWQQVYRTVSCEPRTPQAKTQSRGLSQAGRSCAPNT